MTLQLLDVGGLWPLDADGFILNDAAPSKILPPYGAAIEESVRVYRRHVGQDLHSVYVRGSVARGRAVPGVSDLDCFAVTRRSSGGQDDSWLAAAGVRIANLTPLVTDVQLELWPCDEVMVLDRFAETCFLLKTQSACVWGEDLGPRLPRFKPDVAVANNDICQIEADVEEAIVALKADGSPPDVRYWCRRIMKNILRTGFSLVMLQERSFTRDLKPCYEAFTRHYPDQQTAMRRVLELAIIPSADRDVVVSVLAVFGAWLIAQSDAWLSRHNPARVLQLPLHRPGSGP
ncbi:nucleotidyltransferase domain-containing protein [Specibacter cremeus]|uniref:nucleotidyltransferase domain-containing protein n=1 Tax=Specibacter cremeus TaxID=1629051 RepID=UPI000F78C89E|nr:nucleotidyltransferase domain-containing protein [Specibacter cremeus]